MRVATGLGAESEPTAEGGGVPGLGSDALARLLEALPIGVGLQDPEGRFFWVNPVLVRQLGMPAEQILGHTLDTLPLERLMRDQTRWPDIIGRWDERDFVLVLPETSAESAQRLSEKLRHHIAELPPVNGAEDRTWAVDFGISEWEKGDCAQTLVDRRPLWRLGVSPPGSRSRETSPRSSPASSRPSSTCARRGRPRA